MNRSDSSNGGRFRDLGHLQETLSTGGLALDVSKRKSTPLDVEIAVHAAESLKIVKVSGDPVKVSRGRVEISSDHEAFLGVLFQKTGRSLCDSRPGPTLLNSGDLLVWHSEQTVRFDMPDYFQKVCLLVPLDTFEGVLPEAKSYAGAHFRQRQGVSRLLGSCLSALADDVLTNDEEPGSAVKLTLGLIGAALTQRKESSEIGPRTNLYQRITSFIDRRLGDTELSPTMLARTHHISTRYLHLVFSEHGTTVGRWIKARRLAQCRAELASPSIDRTVTEIARRWGFSDVAHFSRLFRSAYGVAPLKFHKIRRTSNL
ncbi:MAG TPA: helix-turn-helix domain-containing protein [Acidobacteriaceae bacterium]